LELFKIYKRPDFETLYAKSMQYEVDAHLFLFDKIIGKSLKTKTEYEINYTVNHKKHATLFLIITLVFLGGFLYFLHQ